MPRKEVIDQIDHDVYFAALREFGTILQASGAAGGVGGKINSAVLFAERNPPESLPSQGRIDLLIRRREFGSATYRMIAKHYVDRAERIEALPVPALVRASFESKETREKIRSQTSEIAALRARLAAVDAPGEVKQGEVTDPSADRTPEAQPGARKGRRKKVDQRGPGRSNVFADAENPNSERFSAEIDALVSRWNPGDPVPPGFEEFGGELVDVR